MKIKAGIVGATGYAGAELVRLLTAHPEAEISAISSVSFEGDKLSDVYPSYTFLNDMVCENQDAVVEKSDVIFAALPHGLLMESGHSSGGHSRNSSWLSLLSPLQHPR
jgi:N-acetyl-gamma-glutamyl-phosphate reductase